MSNTALQLPATNPHQAANEDVSLADVPLSNSTHRSMGSGEVTLNGKKENFTFEARVVDRVVQICAKAESAAAEFFGGVAAAFSALTRSRSATAAVGAAALLAAGSEEALANRQPNGASDTNYLALGQQVRTNALGSTVSITSTDQNGIEHHASGILWDPWHIITAAHVKLDNGITNTLTRVTSGDNCFSNSCQVAGVVDVRMHDSWDLSHAGPSLDLAIVTLSSPIYGKNAVIGPAPQRDDLCTSSGFGRVHTDAGGDLPFDGNIRGWTSRINRFGNVLGTFSSNYIQQDFNGGSDGATPGGLWNGDSGGNLCDSSNRVVGLNVSWSTSYSYAVRLDVAQPWIVNSIAAEKPRIVSISREASDLRVKWTTVPGATYVVQGSENPADPSTFVDVSSPITFQDSSSGILEFVDSGVLDRSPSRFYRIKKL